MVDDNTIGGIYWLGGGDDDALTAVVFQTMNLGQHSLVVAIVLALCVDVSYTLVMSAKIDKDSLVIDNPKRNATKLVVQFPGLELLDFKLKPNTKDTFEVTNKQNVNLTLKMIADKGYDVFINEKMALDKDARRACVHFGSALWYAMYDVDRQHWPNYFVEDDIYRQVQLGDLAKTVLEDSWLNSDGFVVSLKHLPYQVKQDHINSQPKFCFKPSVRYFVHHNTSEYSFRVLLDKNILEAFRTHRVVNNIRRPKDIPDERMFRSPIWSTWAEYKQPIDQNKVMEYANHILANKFADSQLELDDKWEKNYGDFTFDTAKFPHPKEMVDQLHRKGFRVTLWTYPFVNVESPVFKAKQEFFVKNTKNQTVEVKWWDGTGALVDFRNPKAADWFVERVTALRTQFGIESFKFDAGENSWYRDDRQLDAGDLVGSSNDMTTAYVKTCARLGKMIETRVAFANQGLPIFIRMLDKNSNWGYDKGIRSLIPSALTMSLAGYAFVMPDMIGGNAYGNQPSEELYIRWLQINTFMPTMQFSLAPWRLGAKALNLTGKFIDLHTKYANKFVALAKEVTKTGDPIMRPMWYADPDDVNTYEIEDQFLVGADLLVAPVVAEEATSRSVYLPRGVWVEQNSMKSYHGPAHVNVAAPLEVLPFFLLKTD